MSKISDKYDERLRSEFMSEALEIIEKPISPLHHFTIILIIGIVLAAIIWACLGEIDEVITAAAVIQPKDGIKVVQPLSEGRIAKIFVEEGESVKEGQTLLVLDTETYDINIDNVISEIAMLEYENELLLLLQSDKDIDEDQDKVNNDSFVDVYNVVYSIYQKYSDSRIKLELQTKQYLDQVEIEKNNLEKAITKKENLEKEYSERSQYYMYKPEEKLLENYNVQLEIIKKELEEYKKLYSNNAISEFQLKEKQNEYDSVINQIDAQKIKVQQEASSGESDLSSIMNEIQISDNDIESQKTVLARQEKLYNESQQNLKNLETDYKANISDMILKNNTKLKEYRLQNDLQNEYLGYNSLNSPVDGVVQTIYNKTEGGVVTSAQTIMTIVPENSELIVEAEVQNKDIGSVFIGQDVELKIDAYSFQKYGTLKGKITYISPTAVETQYKGLVYAVRIELESDSFDNQDDEKVISAGMTGTAEIKLGVRPIIEFFMEPIVEYFDGSLKVS